MPSSFARRSWARFSLDLRTPLDVHEELRRRSPPCSRQPQDLIRAWNPQIGRSPANCIRSYSGFRPRPRLAYRSPNSDANQSPKLMSLSSEFPRSNELAAASTVAAIAPISRAEQLEANSVPATQAAANARTILPDDRYSFGIGFSSLKSAYISFPRASYRAWKRFMSKENRQYFPYFNARRPELVVIGRYQHWRTCQLFAVDGMIGRTYSVRFSGIASRVFW